MREVALSAVIGWGCGGGIEVGRGGVRPWLRAAWASLQADLVRLIGSRVLAGDLMDYIRFRAVCPHWRSSSDRPRGRGVIDPRFHPRRWMMLPEGHGLYPGHGKLRGYIRFFNLSTGVIVRVLAPAFRNHRILDSADGLLLLRRDEDTVIRLLHPFTGDIVDLPPLATLMRLPRSQSECDKDLDIFQIDPPQHDGTGSASSSTPSQKLIATCPAGKMPVPQYLAECDSEVLVIGYRDGFFTHPLVYRLSDLILVVVAPVTSIGGNVLFIDERILSVSSETVPSIVGDSIVAIHPADLNKGTISYQHKNQNNWKVKSKWRLGLGH
ncbi:uncharacterized protein LOC124671623 [Lolium rigidum]|uniref:uncharacterized protein LOC124671623 n=1 Tax=Lolium rigidum TaxID=89674 RepID=UPI001F5C4DDA|nr:uncharacterized protein LOC124671623 [Lolium rigidum]